MHTNRGVLRIMLVDDNDDDLFVARLAAERQGACEIIAEAHDGEEGLALLRRDDFTMPDLILLDINMPKLDGFGFLRAKKQDKAIPSVPVVMLTGSGSPEDIRQAYDLGACSYVVKPVDVDRLNQLFQQLAAYWGTLSRLPEW